MAGKHGSSCAQGGAQGPALHVYSPDGVVGGDGSEPSDQATAPPRPLIRNWFTVVHQGQVIQCIGERWWTADAESLPYPCQVDPRCPNESIAVRLIDMVTGEMLIPATNAEISAALERARRQRQASQR